MTCNVSPLCSAPTAGFLHIEGATGLGSTFLVVTSSTMQHNTATSGQTASSFNELQGSGGAIWTNGPYVWISNTSFISNSAKALGGAIFFITSELVVSSALYHMQTCAYARM